MPRNPRSERRSGSDAHAQREAEKIALVTVAKELGNL
jgi:hypothetical protein